MLEDLRRPVVAGDQNIGKRLVVAQLHVEARPQLLDQIGLEQQRLGLGRGRDDLDRHGGRDHAQDARRLRRVDARIGGQPLADVLGLADIEHVVGRVEHAIDAGRGRREPHRAVRSRHGRPRAGPPPPLSAAPPRSSLRQPRLVVLLGGGDRGIEIGGGRRPAAADRLLPAVGAAPRPAPGGGAFGLIGRIVIHGLNLSAGAALHRQPLRGRAGPRQARSAGNTFLRMLSGR